jgi:hypothetical protein
MTVKKTIAQKKKRTVKTASAKKSARRKTLIRNRTRIVGGPAVKICCRCELGIKENEKVLGGSYDGVVCLKHRSCMSCWFDAAPQRGARKHESGKTKTIGLVDKPFKGTKPLCPGCKKGLPPYEKAEPLTYYEEDGVINLIDTP